jgi:hypothetical protein
MRGVDARNGSLFSYVDLEARVPPGHPLRVIRRSADAVLTGMSRQFAAAYDTRDPQALADVLVGKFDRGRPQALKWSV